MAEWDFEDGAIFHQNKESFELWSRERERKNKSTCSPQLCYGMVVVALPYNRSTVVVGQLRLLWEGLSLVKSRVNVTLIVTGFTQCFTAAVSIIRFLSSSPKASLSTFISMINYLSLLPIRISCITDTQHSCSRFVSSALASGTRGWAL